MKGDFKKLAKAWRHSGLSRSRKLCIFSRSIQAKLFYGLPCACFNVADLRWLDGFQCRCLREILGIPPAFLSRVSNLTVYAKSGCQPLSRILLERQLLLLGRVVRASAGNPINYLSFTPGTSQPAVARYVRRVGRPRKEWIPFVTAIAYRITGGHDELLELCRDAGVWKRYIRTSAGLC